MIDDSNIRSERFIIEYTDGKTLVLSPSKANLYGEIMVDAMKSLANSNCNRLKDMPVPYVEFDRRPIILVIDTEAKKTELFRFCAYLTEQNAGVICPDLFLDRGSLEEAEQLLKLTMSLLPVVDGVIIRHSCTDPETDVRFSEYHNLAKELEINISYMSIKESTKDSNVN